jgi:hypothetical protein
MNAAEQVLHDRVNLVRLVRRLEKSVYESDWSTGRNTILWLRSQGLLQVGPFLDFTPGDNSMFSYLCLAIEACKETAKQRRVLQ